MKYTFLTLLSCPFLGYVLAVYLLLHASYGARAGFKLNRLMDRPTEEDRTRTAASTPIPSAHRLRRIPADFQNMATLVLSCRDALEDEDTDLICQIVQAAAGRVEVVVLANDLSESGRIHHVLAAAGLLRPDVRVLAIPHDTRWTRDFGPVCVAEAGRIHFLDFEYNTTDVDLDDDRRRDDQIPLELARWLSQPHTFVPIMLDGGNLIANGEGLVVTTADTLTQNEEIGRNPDDVQNTLIERLGVDQLAVLPPLEDEATGHVDMFATFVAPDVVIVAAIDPREDPVNAVLLDAAADMLEGLPTSLGPLRVHRIPMPLRHEDKWRTYTNVVYLNGVLLMPSYRDVPPPVEYEVCDLYRRLLPGWQIVSVDCSGVIELAGALRCLTTVIPAPGP